MHIIFDATTCILYSLPIHAGTFPVDTTKTRLQVQGQVADKACRGVKYRGMSHALLKIYSEEGLQALYRGLAAATGQYPQLYLSVRQICVIV